MSYTWVWRVENENGYGPYNRNGVGYDAIHEGHTFSSDHDRERHPYIYEWTPGFRFGFATKRQLNRWFNKQERAKLLQLWYKIHKRKAAIVEYYSRQIQFKPYEGP